MRLRSLFLLTLAVALVAGLIGCAEADTSALTEQAHETATASSQLAATQSAATATTLVPPGPTPLAGDGPWTLAFETADGTTLSGVAYGQGTVGIVLAPMYPGGKEGWTSFAQAVAQQRYRALAFDFRGYGESGGQSDVTASSEDLSAAISLLKANGAQQIVVIGAGPGGMAAIKIAPQDAAIRGIVIISSSLDYDEFEITNSDLNALATPSLWLAARNDMTQQVEEMFGQAGSPQKELWIYEGSSVQGTYILEGADGPDMQRRLLEFIASVITE